MTTNLPQWTESRTWDDRTEHRLELPRHDRRPLYLVEFREERAELGDALTPAEEAAGVRVGRSWDDQEYKFFPGHDTGSIRSVSGGYVLTWEPRPGDRIAHVFSVSFVGRQHFQFVADRGVAQSDGWAWDAVSCRPVVNSVHVHCTSTPGRSASLGEDGLEDAWGHDVLPDVLRAALDQEFSGYWLCEVEYKSAPDPDSDAAAYRAWAEAARVRVKREELPSE